MKMFVLGATGGIGRHLLQLALERGHEVTAFVRSPERIGLTHARLRVVPGDVFEADQMAPAMAGHDVVLSSFGPTTLRSTTLRREFGRALASALRKSSVTRVQLVSSALLFPELDGFSRFLRAIIFRRMLPDMAGMEEGIVQSDLEWTVVRPPRLTNGAAKHACRVTDGVLPKGGFLISRADVAHFMIGEAENPSHLRQIVGVAN
jgi:putative NADH-flavin reductase